MCNTTPLKFVVNQRSLYYKNKNTDDIRAVVTIKEEYTNTEFQICLDRLGNVQFKNADAWINSGVIFNFLQNYKEYSKDIYKAIVYTNKLAKDKVFSELDLCFKELLKQEQYVKYITCVDKIKELIEEAHSEFIVEYENTNEYYYEVACKVFYSTKIPVEKKQKLLALTLVDSIHVYKMNSLQKALLEKLNG